MPPRLGRRARIRLPPGDMRKIHERKDEDHERGSRVDLPTGGCAEGSQPAPPAAESDSPFAEALAAAKQQASENYEKYIRAVADMQNVLRRQERERADLGKYAVESLARDLLPTLDDLERALEHSAASPAGEGGLLAGVEMVRKGLLAALEKHGVVRITALGQPFDPSRHEAVGMTDAEDATPNSVVAEHRAGYMIGDRLLRPAMVVVAMPKATAGDA
jgi:molecular chaperone GrpE